MAERVCLLLILLAGTGTATLRGEFGGAVDDNPVAKNQESNFIRKLSTSLTVLGNNGSPSSVFPLGVCQGDCDNDSECQSGLKCFQRTGTEAVPGCSGTGHSGIDYCYDPSSSGGGGGGSGSNNTLTYLGNNGDNVFPLGECQGDCDSHYDCKSGLKCFQRTGTEAVPGCSGTGNPGTDYCYDPSNVSGGGGSGSSSNSLTLLGNNGSPSNVFPLGKCQGDCDEDKDCQTGLQCFQRYASELIPGCSGTGTPEKDYCYDPADDHAGDTSSNFRLKMYWQQGYYWQEETFERKWCMDCGNSGNCTIHYCSPSSSHFEFVKQAYGYQIKISGTNYCLQFMRYSFVQVQICSSSEVKQQWTGTFNESKFEISPVLNTDLCITPPHHPRDTEFTSCYRCAIVRTYDTSLWNKY